MSVCFHIILGTIWAVACWLTILKVLYKKLLGTCICSPMSYFTKFFTPDVSSCCQHEFVTCSHIFKFWNRRLSFMPPGLPNTNWEKLSCFNSMLQVMSHTPKILECVESALASVHTESLHILKEIGSTFQKLTKADTRTSYWIFVKNSSTVSTISLRRAASAFCMVKQLTNVLENRPRQQDLRTRGWAAHPLVLKSSSWSIENEATNSWSKETCPATANTKNQPASIKYWFHV